MTLIDDFFREIDATWQPTSSNVTKLRIIGSTALMIQTTYSRGTTDSDVLEASDLSTEAKTQLLAIAGPASEIARRYHLHIQIVRNGVPFLPHGPLWHVHPCGLAHIEISVLDVTDVVVSKLKRFHGDDRGDIDAMIAHGLVEHPRLIERFKSAVDDFSHDARAAEELPRYVRNLNTVERDFLGVDPTEIELPNWL